MALFRGAEYKRFSKATGQEPLTFYDLNLSAQDHQTFFCCEGDNEKADYASKKILIRFYRVFSYVNGLAGKR